MATSEEIRNWFAANPGASDAQIAAAMQANNVSSGDVASALGVDPGMVAQRYAAATAPASAPAQTPAAAESAGPPVTPETWQLGVSGGLLSHRRAGATDQQYYRDVAAVANKWLANPGTAAEAFRAMSQSGISVSDLLNAGISQSTIDNALMTPTDAKQVAVNNAALNSMTSTLAQNPLMAAEIGRTGLQTIYQNARDYVNTLQQGGLTDAERNKLREAAAGQGWSYADIRAAGLDPSLLFGAPTPVVPTPVTPTPVTRTPAPVFPQPVPYTPVNVYQPLPQQPDIYAAGQPALDVDFRNSPVRTVSPVTGQYMYTPAAKLRPATGAGFSWTPPVVTSRPRQLLDVGPTASASQLYAQSRQAQDRAMRQAFASRNLPMSGANTYYWQSRLRGGDYSPGGVFDPAAFQSDFDTWAASQPPPSAPTGGVSTTQSLTPQMFLNMQPQMFADGGEATSARRMLERLKKAEGTEAESLGAFEQIQEAERAARERAATPLERYTYETLGMEPGLDRATFLPIAGRGEDRQLAMPGFVYEAGKALMTPGAAASGVPLSYEDVSNLAGNVMGGGYATSAPIDGAVAGMAVKQKGGNWLSGYIERGTEPLRIKTAGGMEPSEALEQMLKNYPADTTHPDLMRQITPVFQQLERNTALNRWIDTKLNRYIKNEMATPEDPLRIQADQWAVEQQRLLADKDAQIAKATADMERARAERGFTPEMMTRSQAQLRELQRERALIANRTGMHVNPQQLNFRLEMYGAFPLEGQQLLAQSPAAKVWEGASDNAISIDEARRLLQTKNYETGTPTVENNPWLAKVPPGTPVNSLDDRAATDLGFDHMVDELKNALDPESGLPEHLLINPAKLEKMTVPQIAKHVDEINAWRSVQIAEANAARAANAATVPFRTYETIPGTDLPNERGLRWVELRRPAVDASNLPEGYELRTLKNNQGNVYFSLRDMNNRGLEIGAGMTPEAALKDAGSRIDVSKPLEDALKYEGEMLQHCVGGYCPDVEEGRSRIYSLRDAEGKPHATIEVEPNPHPYPIDPASGYMRLTPAEQAQYGEYVREWRRRNPDIEELTNENVVQALREAGVPPKPDSIVQIKGKQNRAPNAEYLPFVQDFVRSGQWSSVDDLQNTGLTKIGESYVTTEELKPLAESALRYLEQSPALEAHRRAEQQLSDVENEGWPLGPLAPEYDELWRLAGMKVHPDVPYTYREMRSIFDDPKAYPEGFVLENIERVNRLRQLYGEEGFANGGEVTAPQTESRSMLERLQRFASLDTPQDMSLGETAVDIGMGFLPIVGTAQGARDFERARREDDTLGMVLGAASMIPVVGGAAKLGKKAVGSARQMLDEVVPAAMNWYHGTNRNILDAAGNLDLKVGPRGAVFLTPDPQFAGKYALNDTTLNPDDIDRMVQQGVTPPEGAAIYPVRPNVSNTFDINNKDHIAKLKSAVTVGGARKQRWKPAAALIEEKIAQGNPWAAVERLLPDIKAAGFDSAFVEEMGRTNLAVFDPKNVESAVRTGSARQMLNEVAPAARQIDTPEFKNWFGESKVVDESGQPLRVYHGTTKDFSRFTPSKEGALGSGIYTTPDPAFASEYAKETGANILPAYVSMKKPLILGMDTAARRDPMIEALQKLGMDEGKAEQLVERAYDQKGYVGKQVQNRAASQGYDGIMQYRDGKLVEVVPFYPTQIKSAIGNEGTFDPTNPVITKAKGGEVTTAELLAQMDRIGTVDREPTEEDSRGAFDALVEAERRAARKPDPVQTESRGMLDRLNRAAFQNVTQPVVGSLVDMTVGLGDVGQMATKYLAGRTRGPLAQRFLGADPRTGIQTDPVTPLAPKVREALGMSGYDPDAPLAVATQIALPALSRANAVGQGALRGARMTTRAPRPRPGSAKELAQRIGGEAAAEGQRWVGSELGATIARDVAPGNTAAELLAAVAGSTAINTLQSLDPRDMSRVVLGMADYTGAPKPEYPFVGRLDRYVAENIKNPLTKAQFLGQLRGKFREYDILRAQQALEGVGDAEKLTPDVLLNRLGKTYDPADIKVTMTTGSMSYSDWDNPWKGVSPSTPSSSQHRTGTIVLSRGGEQGEVTSSFTPEQVQAAQKFYGTMLRGTYALNPTDPQSEIPVAEALLTPQGAIELQDLIPVVEGRNQPDVLNNLRSLLSYSNTYRDDAGHIANIGQVTGMGNFPILFGQRYAQLLEDGGIPPEDMRRIAAAQAYSAVYQSHAVRAEDLSGFYGSRKKLPTLFPNDFADMNSEEAAKKMNAVFAPFANELLAKQRRDYLSLIKDNLSRLPASLENELVYTPPRVIGGSNPGYMGQHASVTANTPNQIAFSRFTDVKTELGGRPVTGLYLHEMQSDLLDDIRTKGKRGEGVNELQARISAAQSEVDKTSEKLTELRAQQAQLTTAYQETIDQEAAGTITNAQAVARRRELDNRSQSLIEEEKTLNKRFASVSNRKSNLQNALRAAQSGTMPDLDEAFPGMEANSKALQQLMMKAAVAKAVESGRYGFVAFTTPQYSQQPQLYRLVPQNARDVVKDLGEGFKVEQIRLEGRDGPFNATAIVFDEVSAADREGVNRVLTQGMPFAKGGEVKKNARQMLESAKESLKGIADRVQSIDVPQLIRDRINDTDLMQAKRYAEENSVKYFPKETEWGGEADALRHILFQSELANRMGGPVAKATGFINEYPLNLGQLSYERDMDFSNDAIGREIGLSGMTQEQRLQAAIDAVKTGRATILTPEQQRAAPYRHGGEVVTDPEDVKNLLSYLDK